MLRRSMWQCALVRWPSAKQSANANRSAVFHARPHNYPTLAVFPEILRVANRHVIWGGNYFAHLPPSRGWLVWYKMDGLPPLQFSEWEMSWTSCSTKSKVFNCRHRDFLKDSKCGNHRDENRPARFMYQRPAGRL